MKLCIKSVFLGLLLFAVGLSAEAEVTPNPVVTGVAREPPYTHRQEFTASGTFTVPSGVYTLYATYVGGGGGGGGGDNNATTGGGGGGGASGGIFCRVPYRVNPGDTITVTIGTGGSAGTGGASASAGGNGTETTITGSTALQPELRASFGKGGAAGADAAGGAGGAIGQPNASFLWSVGGGAEGVNGSFSQANTAQTSFPGQQPCFAQSGGGGNDNGGVAGQQVTGMQDDIYVGATNGGGAGGVNSIAYGVTRHLGAANTGETGQTVPATCYGCGGGGGFGAGGGTNGSAGQSGAAILEW